MFNRWVREDNGVLNDIYKSPKPIVAELTEELTELLSLVAIVVYIPDDNDAKSESIFHEDEEKFSPQLQDEWVKFFSSRGISEFRFMHGQNALYDTLDSIDNSFEYLIICEYTTFLFIPNILQAIHERRLAKYEEELYMGFPVTMTGSDSNDDFFAKKNGNEEEMENMLFGSIRGGIIMNRYSKISLQDLRKDFAEIAEKKKKIFSMDEIIGRTLLLRDIKLAHINSKKKIQHKKNSKELAPAPYGFYPVSPDVIISWLNDESIIPKNYYRKEENPFWLYEPPLSYGSVFAVRKVRETLLGVQKIPKIVHQIWIGNKPIPKEILDCKRKFEACGWEYYIWNDENISWLKNKKIYSQIGEIHYKRADIIRLEVLYKYGGIVIDGDSICLRSMDVLLEDTYDVKAELFASCEHEEIRPGLIATGIVGAVPKSLSMLYILRSLHLTNVEGVAWVSVGPFFFTRVVRAFDLPINVLNSKLFFPLHHTQVKRTVKRYVTTRMYELSKKYHSYTIQLWGSTFLFSEVIIKTPKRSDKYLWHVDSNSNNKPVKVLEDVEKKVEVKKEIGGGDVIKNNENENSNNNNNNNYNEGIR